MVFLLSACVGSVEVTGLPTGFGAPLSAWHVGDHVRERTWWVTPGSADLWEETTSAPWASVWVTDFAGGCAAHKAWASGWEANSLAFEAAQEAAPQDVCSNLEAFYDAQRTLAVEVWPPTWHVVEVYACAATFPCSFRVGDTPLPQDDSEDGYEAFALAGEIESATLIPPWDADACALADAEPTGFAIDGLLGVDAIRDDGGLPYRVVGDLVDADDGHVSVDVVAEACGLPDAEVLVVD